jgi:hypothetical protein
MSCSPCGKRAFVRVAIALSTRYTTKKVVILSTGSLISPCPSVAAPMSAPAWRNAATRKSVPAPVTPPNRLALIGALMSAATTPVMSPATTTYAAVRSRRTNMWKGGGTTAVHSVFASRPVNAPGIGPASAPTRIVPIESK